MKIPGLNFVELIRFAGRGLKDPSIVLGLASTSYVATVSFVCLRMCQATGLNSIKTMSEYELLQLVLPHS